MKPWLKIFFILHSTFFIIHYSAFAQFDAGQNDTINPGVPVTLTSSYGVMSNGVILTDDDIEGPFPIGFNFSFFGDIFHEFYIGSNGWISFTKNVNWAGTREAFAVPSAADYNPKNCILGPFQDLNPLDAGGPYVFYQTIGQQPDQKLVVMFCQVPMYSEPCKDSIMTFQIVLDETSNTIENYIYHKPSCPNWLQNKATLAIQNKDGFIGFSVPTRNGTSWTAWQEGWKYTPIKADSFEVTSIPYKLEPIIPGNKISYSWYQGSEQIGTSQSITVSPTESTEYHAHMILCNGQEYIDSLVVVVIPYIPNAFTPNGDGKNDLFKITGLPYDHITRFNLQVYNRFGQRIFSTFDIREGWDGKDKGVECQEGVYLWVILYEDDKKIQITNKGTITLIR